MTIVEPEPFYRLDVDPAGPTVAGRFRLLFQAPIGEPFTIQASIDLLHWTAIQSFAAQTTLDPQEFEDMEGASTPQRFYRIVVP